MPEELALVQLSQKRDQLRKELKEIEAEINRIPSTFNKYFKLLKDGEFKDLLISRIRSLEKKHKTTTHYDYETIIFENVEGETWEIIWGYGRGGYFCRAKNCYGVDNKPWDIDFDNNSKNYYWAASDTEMGLEEFLLDILKKNNNDLNGYFLAIAIFNACEDR